MNNLGIVGCRRIPSHLRIVSLPKARCSLEIAHGCLGCGAFWFDTDSCGVGTSRLSPTRRVLSPDIGNFCPAKAGMKAESRAWTRPNRGKRIEIACSGGRNSLMWRIEFPVIAAGNFARHAVERHANPRIILRLLAWKRCRKATIGARKTSISGNIRERAKTFALRRAPRSFRANRLSGPGLRPLRNPVRFSLALRRCGHWPVPRAALSGLDVGQECAG